MKKPTDNFPKEIRSRPFSLEWVPIRLDEIQGLLKPTATTTFLALAMSWGITMEKDLYVNGQTVNSDGERLCRFCGADFTDGKYLCAHEFGYCSASCQDAAETTIGLLGDV